jgi:hypothetical protein
MNRCRCRFAAPFDGDGERAAIPTRADGAAGRVAGAKAWQR